MPVINRIAEFADQVAEWRRDFHTHPELEYDLPRTSGKVAELLTSFGVDELVTGIAQTGVVAVIKGRGPGKTIGLRADMDASPIIERTGKAYASQTSGRMHACGHDGHTSILLGTAKYLSETRNFDSALGHVAISASATPTTPSSSIHPSRNPAASSPGVGNACMATNSPGIRNDTKRSLMADLERR